MTKNIQSETFDYIKKFIEEKGRPPRLKELTSHFEVTNNALLERLRKLEEDGLITMPDGVLSMKVLKKNNDIFLSYSRENADLVKKIYDSFQDEGFRIWKDNIKLEHGDNFVNEIFENIRNSKTFLVLLSKSSLDSRFVRDEVAAAKQSFIDFGYPNILPIKVTDDYDKSEVFPEIAPLQYVNFSKIENEDDFGKKMMELADRIHRLAYNIPTQENKALSTKGVKEFMKKVEDDLETKIKENPPPGGTQYPYRQVTVFPLGEREGTNIEQLKQLNRDIAVQIMGWGGDRFPPYYYMHGKEADTMDGWIRDANLRAWPGRTWGLEYWAMDKSYNFFTRSVLREVYSKEEGGRYNLEEKFSMDWLIFDVCRALMYARSLIEKIGLKKVKITIKYSGLRNKELVLLSMKRWGFDESYKCYENEISRDIVVDGDSNIKEFAVDLCHEILTLFNWNKPNKQVLEADITKLIDEKRFND